MRRIMLRIYAIVWVLALLTLTVVFFVRLHAERSHQEAQAAQAFLALSEAIHELWNSQTLEAASDAVSARFSTGRAPVVVSVFSFEEGLDYLWASDGSYIGVAPDAAQARPDFVVNDLLHRRFSRSIELQDGSRRIISAAYEVLNAPIAYPLLRDTLMVLLALVALSIALALIHVLSRSPVATTAMSTPPAAEATPRPTPEVEAGSTGIAPSEAVRESALLPRHSLEARIQNELDRAAYHEYDLSIAFLAFEPAEVPAVTDIEKVLLSFFTVGDLVINAGEHEARFEVAVLFPQSNLPQALATVERFQRLFWDETSTWVHEHCDFYAGISARNGRIVEPARVIQECQAALRRARRTPGHIMGFRPDPQKYRSYVAGVAAESANAAGSDASSS